MARRVGRVALLALIAGGEANLDGVAPYVAAEESGERVARCVAGVEDKAGASVFVVGAHLFGEDPNDPIYAAVAAHGWGAVYVVEPNPLIFDELVAFLARPGTFMARDVVVPELPEAGHDGGWPAVRSTVAWPMAS